MAVSSPMSSPNHEIQSHLFKADSEETQSDDELQRPLPNVGDSVIVTQNPSYSCLHLSELRSQLGPSPFSNLREYIRVRPLGRASIYTGENIRCSVCRQAPPRLYACVSCDAVACVAHMKPHAEETSHHVAVDVDRAELFCSACMDQVYDCDFDADVVAVFIKGGQENLTPQENLRKRKRVEYKPWTPGPNERALIEEMSTPLPLPGGEQGLPPGLRGLNNLGSTCFMNSILQALLHAPPLRNYFLSDKHNRFYCERENRTIGTRTSEVKNKNVQLCLACDLDAIFSAVFSGNRLPYSPAKFLYSWWQHASNLATYEQQDAHEFFISMLDGIHGKLLKDKWKPHNPGYSSRFFELP